MEETEQKDIQELLKDIPLSNRMPKILDCQVPEKIIQGLSDEEVLFMYYQSDTECQLQLIDLADDDQIMLLSDFLLWNKDQVHLPGFLQWLEDLDSLDQDKLKEWIHQADIELLIASFKKYVRVLKSPAQEDWEDELLEDDPYFTIAGLYYIQLPEKANFDLTQRIFQMIYESDRAMYVSLMEGLLSEYEWEMEEGAYQARQDRLWEKGFPEKEEAMQIYRPVSEEEWNDKKSPQEHMVHLHLEHTPHYPVLVDQKNLFIDRVLATLHGASPETRDCLELELVSLANRIIIANDISLADEPALAAALDQAKFHINICLEQLTGVDILQASRILQEHWLQHIFQKGFQETIILRDDLEGRLRSRFKGNLNDFILFWNAPYENILRGILRKHPLYYDPTNNNNTFGLRHFRCLSDLRKTRQKLENLEAIVDHLIHNDISWSSFVGQPYLKAEIVFMTFAVCTIVFQQDHLAPFSLEALEKLSNQGLNMLTNEALQSFVKKTSPPQRMEASLRFMEQLLVYYREELKQLAGKPTIDPKDYATLFMVESY